MKTKKYLLTMPEALHKDLKMVAIDTDISMQDLMLQAIEDVVKKVKAV